MEESIEVEASLVFQKKISLHTVINATISCMVNVFESSHPYVLIFVVTITDSDHNVRMNVDKDKLTEELKLWMDGKYIRKPCFIASKSVEDAMVRFVKYGKTPRQQDLIHWVLSRTQLQFGKEPELIFGGMDILGPTVTESPTLRESKTQAFRVSERTSEHFLQGLSSTHEILTGGTMRTTENPTYELTKALLGTKSQSIDALKKSTVKGREGAKASTVLKSNDHFILASNIERARKEIEEAIEKRRRMIEIAKTRKDQMKTKYKTIRDEFNESKNNTTWLSKAIAELQQLQQVKEDIENDIKRHKSQSIREQRLTSWTCAPPGFSVLRGKSKPGPVLGEGPLPFSATSTLRDPRVESTIRHFYWDTSGRRHKIDHVKSFQESDTYALLQECFDAIKKMSQGDNTYKFDLKGLFEKFDTSGDGFLSKREFTEAMLQIGVNLDFDTVDIIYKHFDPNESGSIHYGEFIWSFFNRRDFLKQYKSISDKIPREKMLAIFHRFDNNGNGKLNFKEFKKLLDFLGIDLEEGEVKVLIDRFDSDQSGDIDLKEFDEFVNKELKAIDIENATKKPIKMAETAALERRTNKDPLAKSLERPKTPNAKPTRPSSASRPVTTSQTLPNTSTNSVTSSIRPATARPASTSRPVSASNAKAKTMLPQSGHSQSAANKLNKTEQVRRNKANLENQTMTLNLEITGNSVGSNANIPIKGLDASMTSTDVLKMADILKAQSTIESKLGKKYYNSA